MRGAARKWNRRLVAAALALTALTAVYVLLLREFRVAEEPREQSFGAADAAGQILVRPLAVDALNRAMQIQVYLTPRLADGEGAAVSAADRDMTLVVGHDRIATEIRLAVGDRLAAATVETGLEGGAVSAYPLDSYRARLGVALRDAKGVALPARVTVWEGLLGFDLHATADGGRAGEIPVTIAVARSGAFAMFALCAYAAMLALAGCAVVIGFLTFSEVRRAEVALIGALAAMTFALPAFRNALPGAPPLGVAADMWVFLWTELAVVLALGLVVYRWTKAGPPP